MVLETASLLRRRALLTVADNPMTLSWGSFGTLFGEPVCTLYIRPSRHTATLLAATPRATLSFLPESAASDAAYAYCGAHSGRDGEKWTAAGLTPRVEDGVCRPAEAETVLFLRLLCRLPLTPDRFAEGEWEKVARRFFENGDLHTLFLFRIEKEREYSK